MKKFTSSCTLYFLAHLKLLFWSLAMVFVHAEFYTQTKFFFLGNAPITKYIMLLFGVLGMLNIFKFNSRAVYAITCFFCCSLWTYVTIGYGVSTNFVGALFYRNLPETFLYIWMTFQLLDKQPLCRTSRST